MSGLFVTAPEELLVLGLLPFRPRRSEERTLAFPEPVERVEVAMQAGAVSVVASQGQVLAHRTTRWLLGKPNISERVADGVLNVDVRRRPWQLGGEISCRF